MLRSRDRGGLGGFRLGPGLLAHNYITFAICFNNIFFVPRKSFLCLIGVVYVFSTVNFEVEIDVGYAT